MLTVLLLQVRLVSTHTFGQHAAAFTWQGLSHKTLTLNQCSRDRVVQHRGASPPGAPYICRRPGTKQSTAPAYGHASSWSWCVPSNGSARHQMPAYACYSITTRQRCLRLMPDLTAGGGSAWVKVVAHLCKITSACISSSQAAVGHAGPSASKMEVMNSHVLLLLKDKG